MAEALRILTCDDNPADSRLLEVILHPEHIGCMCSELPDVATVAGLYDTIVVDDNLGRGNPTAGLEFLEALYQHHRSNGLAHPVRLLVSGTINPHIAHRAHAIGAIPLPKAAVADAVVNDGLAMAIRQLVCEGLLGVQQPQELMPYLTKFDNTLVWELQSYS